MAQTQLNISQDPLQSPAVSGEPQPGSGSCPLSFPQESLWFVEQMAPGTATYHLPEAWRFKGPLDLAALQSALDELARRHEILRTRIDSRDGRPEQIILSRARIELSLVDLSAAEKPDAELERQLQAEARRPFDLRRAPLVRTVLFRSGPRDHTLLLNLHHIIADAWSQRLFMRELALCYSACLMEEPKACNTPPPGKACNSSQAADVSPSPLPKGRGVPLHVPSSSKEPKACNTPPPAEACNTSQPADVSPSPLPEGRGPGRGVPLYVPSSGSLRKDAAPSLPSLPVQYADFALWQREMLQSPAAQEDLAYWQKVLRQPFKPLLLTADRPRRPSRSWKGATRFHCVPRELTDRLRELSRRESVTLFMTLLAGFKALLHRYTGEHDVVIGSPLAGRDRVEIENLIGLFVNTHALRCDLSGDPTFRELLARVREVVLGASAHQELPGEVVLQNLQPARTAAGHPFFEIVFGWQGQALDRLALPGLEATRIDLDTGTAKFEWTLLVSESQDGTLLLRSEFSTDLFDPETMDRLLRHFLTLLAGAAQNPTGRISALPLMTEAEMRTLLVDYNQTASDYERDLGIHQLFERHVLANPDATALTFEGQAMTYAALNARANQLARRLHAAGVSPGARVALCLERSCELIVGILAILKAGAAYVPLDRSYPQERLQLMLQDSGCAVLVTDAKWLSGRPAFEGVAKVICLDQEQQRLEQESTDNLPTTAGASSPAYVMYTSGSTGTPKGVQVSHRAVVRLVRNTNYLNFSRDLVFLQLAPITFDASTFEIWGALLNGARLVIYPPGVPSLEQLGRTLRLQDVTVLWLTAGLFQQMVEAQLGALRGLKYLLAGGDVLSPAHVAKVARELRDCQFINGYGPTENTTFSCCYRLPSGEWPADRPVPIGRPISNTRLYVLDSRMAPVPVGVPGELYLSGDGLADGYLRQPDLTAAKFVPNPFSDDPCPRLYRTGDLVRWQADGNLQFLARIDSQVKIRGYRVEPGEVEAALASHPEVQAAAVIAREDHSGTKQLFAYVVARPPADLQESQLREYLAQKLPPYLVPARILILNALPLTPNGKIDRAALPDPGRNGESSDPGLFVAPRTPTEKTLHAIWCEVLERSQVGIHEDFFHLGGHSLLATRVISRVASKCGLELPVVAIFEAPTIARLARLLEKTGQAQPACPPPVIQRAAPGRAAELLQHLGELDEAQVDALLSDPELKSLL